MNVEVIENALYGLKEDILFYKQCYVRDIIRDKECNSCECYKCKYSKDRYVWNNMQQCL